MPPPTKRRRTEPTVIEEITFDPTARHEFLTGFHKRKLQRAKHAQEAAERRVRAERLEERRKLREERKAELERHVEEVNAMLRPPSASDDEDGQEGGTDSDSERDGISDSEPPPVDHEAEYVDEEKYTTVTVETMDVSKEGLFKAQQEQQEEDGLDKAVKADVDSAVAEKKKRQWTKQRPKDQAKGKKKRNFRYESKVERKQARTKERAGNRKQARERRADR